MANLPITQEQQKALSKASIEQLESIQDQMEVIENFRIPRMIIKDCFSVPGSKDSDTFLGVIIHAHLQRKYYDKPYNPKDITPATCFSFGGKEPTGGTDMQADKCSRCPKNKLSKEYDGSNPACTPNKMMLIRTHKSLIPVLMKIAPTSLGEVDKYFNGLLASGEVYWKLNTRFSLFKKKDSQVHYNVKLEADEKVEDEKDMKAYREIWRKYLEENRADSENDTEIEEDFEGQNGPPLS